MRENFIHLWWCLIDSVERLGISEVSVTKRSHILSLISCH